MNILADNLKELRESRGYKQSYVAGIVGVSEATISKYENGKQDPTYENLIKLANLYNESLDNIFSRDRFIVNEGDDTSSLRVSKKIYTFISLLQKEEYSILLDYILKDPEQRLKLILSKIRSYL